MTSVEVAVQRAAIFGVVRDALDAQCIAGALVEIPARQLATHTRHDGSYWFCDLLAGEYTLRISVPHLGTRYGVVNISGVAVATESSGKPILDARASVQLSPTHVIGRVTDAADAAALAGAMVRLRGAEARVQTTATGNFCLGPLVASAPTLEVSARGYVSAVRTLTLTAGQQANVDIALSRSSA